jgi:hypothetical protein
LVTFSQINQESQQEAYLSGFESFPDGKKEKFEDVEDIRENFEGSKYYDRETRHTNEYGKYMVFSNDKKKNEYVYEYPYDKNYIDSEKNIANIDVINNINYDDVDIQNVYDPKQVFTSSLPSNYPSGKCDRDEQFKQYNKNLFTQIIEPGAYSVNQVIEPIDANIGISFTQQFEPTTKKVKGNEVMYTEHDPFIIEPVLQEKKPETINTANIYDPRFSGYGTSYRSYTDDMLGQTKFMYDDINAIRMPNYVTRSKIDNQPFADTYGPINKEDFTDEFSEKVRSLTNNAFFQDTSNYRQELEERLLRKSRANGWQQRVAPIRSSGQYMLGGMASCR